MRGSKKPVLVVTARIERRDRPAKQKKKKVHVPNKDRAVTNGKIATIYHGRRIVQIYRSGQPLKGKVQ